MTNYHCLVPNCGRMRHLRGNCLKCYDRVIRLIRAGETTWEALVAAGLALPAQTSEARGQRLDWCFEKKGGRS